MFKCGVLFAQGLQTAQATPDFGGCAESGAARCRHGYAPDWDKVITGGDLAPAVWFMETPAERTHIHTNNIVGMKGRLWQ